MVPNRISVPLDDKNGDGRAEQKVMKASAKLSVSYARSTTRPLTVHSADKFSKKKSSKLPLPITDGRIQASGKTLPDPEDLLMKFRPPLLLTDG